MSVSLLLRRFLVGLLIPIGALGAVGCWEQPSDQELDLKATPFANPFVERGQATLTRLLATGYPCPSESGEAQVYVVRPEGESEHPLALLFHGRPFDYVNDLGEHYELVDRLDLGWAQREVELALGISVETNASEPSGGAWVAALLAQGYAVASPTNCWGDLWNGEGRNSEEDSFLRWGAYLAYETIGLASALDGVTSDRLVAIGLGEGGRAITELIHQGTALDAVVIDSSPDWLSPVLTQATTNQRTIDGLERVYAADLYGIDDPGERREALREALARDSLVHLVEDQGFRSPIIYAWSPTDERIDPSAAEPAANTIAAHYPPNPHQVREWLGTEHAPSNRYLETATELFTWVENALGPFGTAGSGDDDDSSPGNDDDDSSAGDDDDSSAGDDDDSSGGDDDDSATPENNSP